MKWRDKYSLSIQFLLAAAVVLCVSMAVLGTWITHRITRSVLATSGQGGSDLMVSLMEAEVQTLVPGGTMSAESQLRLDQAFARPQIATRIVSVKIWRTDGTVIYASKAKDTIGKTFASTDVVTAASGKIVAEFKDMVSAESAYEQSLNKALIEVYSPLYLAGTKTVIAVGEIYEDATALERQLRADQRQTWAVVGLTTLAMLGFLYLSVRHGSITIRRQRIELKERVSEAQRMAAQNECLRLEANEANEELLGRIGFDIHDGPIQALTLTRLRLDEVADLWNDPQESRAAIREHFDVARCALSDSIDELRHLSTGLILPELDELPPRQLIELAVHRHERATASEVELDLGALPQHLPQALKICIYRIIQESLTNAFRHAGGVGQQVAAQVQNNILELRISDQGAQPATPDEAQAPRAKLGHRGIRNRVRAFGGKLSITSTEAGTDVRASLPLNRDAAQEQTPTGHAR